MGILIIVQGSKEEPNIMNEKIEELLIKRVKNKIETMDKEYFEKIINSEREILLQVYLSLIEKGKEFWEEIIDSNEKPDFTKKFKYAEKLNKITLDNLKNFYSNFFNGKISFQIFNAKNKKNLKEISIIKKEESFNKINSQIACFNDFSKYDWFKD